LCAARRYSGVLFVAAIVFDVIPSFGADCCFVTRVCSRIARASNAVGTTFRRSGQYVRIIGCVGCCVAQLQRAFMPMPRVTKVFMFLSLIFCVVNVIVAVLANSRCSSIANDNITHTLNQISF
jgi:hypothetical protein